MRNVPEQIDGFKPRISRNVKFKFLKEDERGRFYIVEKAGKKGKPVYLRIHEAGKEIISLMDGKLTLSQIDEMLKKRDIEVDLTKFVRLLGRRGFIQNFPYIEEARSEDKAKLRVRHFAIFKKPEKFVARIYSPLRYLFTTKMFILFVICNIVVSLFFGLSLLLNMLELGGVSILHTSSFVEFLLYMIVLFPLLGILHELGHAIMCYHYNRKIGAIGVSIYLFAPFFYADTSGTWMLSKKQSIMIFLAGPLFSLFIGNLSFLLRFLVAFPHSEVLLMITYASYFSIIFGFNPLMETDGYYVLQTLTDFPNLHSNAWEFVETWLKHRLGRVSEREYTEYLSCYSRSERRILSLYAPLVVATNIVFILLSIFWIFLLANGYANLTLRLCKSLWTVETSTIILWIFETFYLSMITFVVLRGATKAVIKRISDHRHKRKFY